MARYHSSNAAELAAQEFSRVFRDRGLPEKIEDATDEYKEYAKKVGDFAKKLTHILVGTGMLPSTSEARRKISDGAVKVDGEKVTDAGIELSPGKTYTLQVGKRKFKKVTIAA